jgi:hypothetical protein
MPTASRHRTVQPDRATEEVGFDELVKGLASGTMSRKRVITLLGAVLLAPWLPRVASAQEGCTTCTRPAQTGLCSNINPEQPQPFQPCCTDTSTTTTPGSQVPSDCACMRGFQQDPRGRLSLEPTCVPTDQTCRRLAKCSRRDPRCGSGRVCVLGSCCNTPAEFNRGIGVCAQTGVCEPVLDTTAANSSRRGPTLTSPGSR